MTESYLRGCHAMAHSNFQIFNLGVFLFSCDTPFPRFPALCHDVTTFHGGPDYGAQCTTLFAHLGGASCVTHSRQHFSNVRTNRSGIICNAATQKYRVNNMLLHTVFLNSQKEIAQRDVMSTAWFVLLKMHEREASHNQSKDLFKTNVNSLENNFANNQKG